MKIWGHVGHDVPPFPWQQKKGGLSLACCTHRVRRILLLVEEWEGTFRTTRNTLLGSFHRKCGRRFRHSLESKAGEDLEWRAFFSTLSTQKVDRTFLQEWGGPSLAPSRNADSCQLFLQTVGGIILASPHDNLGGLSSSIFSKARMGRDPWLSPTMWRGFLKRQ